MRQTRLSPISLVSIALAGGLFGLGCAEPAAPAQAGEARPAAPTAIAPPTAAAAEAASQRGATSASPSAAPPGAAAPSAARVAPPAASAPEGPGPAPSGEPPGDRIYAKARHVWIQPAPRPSKGWLGYLTLGGSVRLWEGSAERARVQGAGCDAWYKVEPAGYVCAGEDATLDPKDPAFVELAARSGDASSPYPFQYAESIGARRYDELPSAAEQRQREWDLPEHQARLERARSARSAADVPKEVLGVDLAPAGKGPPELFPFGGKVREARDSVAPTSTIAFVDAFDHGGRTWLLTSDRMLVPKDRTRPYPPIDFQGVHLGDAISLPIAFFRKKDRPAFRRGEGDAFVEDGAFARKSWVGLTGERAKVGAEVFLETREPGKWVKEEDAAIAARAESPPDPDLLSRAGRQTWIDVSVLGGTLVAYEGLRPVFATLIAPGRGGIPFPGRDPISTASTPTGTFRVDGKFVWATMVSSTDSSIVHAEVMYVQNFHGAHALHGAYWHDAWGELKSGGCVNLSPIDARWLFGWTEPKVPRGWHGLRSVPDFGRPTIVRVRR